LLIFPLEGHFLLWLFLFQMLVLLLHVSILALSAAISCSSSMSFLQSLNDFPVSWFIQSQMIWA
jgi:hypothetical protein